MSGRKQINCTKCGEALKELITELKKNKFVNLESFFAVDGNEIRLLVHCKITSS